MKFLDTTPEQFGCTGTLLVLSGLVGWVLALVWVINWLITHVRFV